MFLLVLSVVVSPAYMAPLTVILYSVLFLSVGFLITWFLRVLLLEATNLFNWLSGRSKL